MSEKLRFAAGVLLGMAVVDGLINFIEWAAGFNLWPAALAVAALLVVASALLDNDTEIGTTVWRFLNTMKETGLRLLTAATSLWKSKGGSTADAVVADADLEAKKD